MPLCHSARGGRESHSTVPPSQPRVDRQGEGASWRGGPTPRPDGAGEAAAGTFRGKHAGSMERAAGTASCEQAPGS